MKKFIKLSVLTLAVSSILNAGTVNTGNQIKIKIPGSASNRDKNIGVKSNSSKTVVINGSSQTKTITMNGGTLKLTGAANNITVKGTVSSVIITGASNTLNIDSVSTIEITGADNKVYYKTSPTKSGVPSGSISGAGNKISKR